MVPTTFPVAFGIYSETGVTSWCGVGAGHAATQLGAGRLTHGQREQLVRLPMVIGEGETGLRAAVARGSCANAPGVRNGLGLSSMTALGG